MHEAVPVIGPDGLKSRNYHKNDTYFPFSLDTRKY